MKFDLRSLGGLTRFLRRGTPLTEIHPLVLGESGFDELSYKRCGERLVWKKADRPFARSKILDLIRELIED